MRIAIISLVFVSMCVCAAEAATVEADGSGDFATIQDAINAAAHGGTVVLKRGVFEGDGNRDLDLRGKNLTIRSVDPSDPNCVENTIIDCGGRSGLPHRGFDFHSGEGSDTLISGLTIRGGYANHGGAIYVSDLSSPRISNCILTENAAAKGGAIYIDRCRPEFSNCVITANEGIESAGAIYFAGYATGGSASLTNCLIFSNEAGRDGGAITADDFANPLIANCTISDNRAVDQINTGGGIFSSQGSTVRIIDSIVWGNRANVGRQITAGIGYGEHGGGQVEVSYSAIEGGQDGINILVEPDCLVDILAGVIFDNPRFMSGSGGDYYLSQLVAGDRVQSPCVDAGSDTAAAFGMDKFTTRSDRWFDTSDVGVVDMGYHYPQLPPKIACRYCDLVLDGVIDLADVSVLAANWLGECAEPGWCAGSDINIDSVVNLVDVGIVGRCWMVEDDVPPEPNTATWVIEPRILAPDSALMEMSAKVSNDEWLGGQVEYYFECFTDPSQSSGWRQDYDPSNTETYVENPEYYFLENLAMDRVYGFILRVRDRVGNVTKDSKIASARTGHELDPPTPNPSGWDEKPRFTGPHSVIMSAVVSQDSNGPVQYEFMHTDADGVRSELWGGSDSGWQNSAVYVDGGLLEEDRTYYYRVRARDKYENMTGWSAVSSTDHNAPVPNPPQWDVDFGITQVEVYIDGSWSWYHRLVVQPVFDPEGYGVEYRFQCFDFPQFSSGWQNSQEPPRDPLGNVIGPNEYWVFTGADNVKWNYLVQTRDQSADWNESAWSESIRLR